MSCNIVINQQGFLTVLDRVSPDAKMEDPERQKREKITRNIHENLKDRFLKNN